MSKQKDKRKDAKLKGRETKKKGLAGKAKLAKNKKASSLAKAAI